MQFRIILSVLKIEIINILIYIYYYTINLNRVMASRYKANEQLTNPMKILANIRNIELTAKYIIGIQNFEKLLCIPTSKNLKILVLDSTTCFSTKLFLHYNLIKESDAWIIENNKTTYLEIRRQLPNAHVYYGDIYDVLSSLKLDITFDVVYLDGMSQFHTFEKSIKIFFEKHLLSNNAIFTYTLCCQDREKKEYKERSKNHVNIIIEFANTKNYKLDYKNQICSNINKRNKRDTANSYYFVCSSN